MEIKVDFSGGGLMRVRFPGRTWNLAHDVVEDLKDHPPEGYTLLSSQVNRRGSTRSGRRCNIKLLFRYTDSRVEPLTAKQSLLMFVPYAAQAQGGTA